MFVKNVSDRSHGAWKVGRAIIFIRPDESLPVPETHEERVRKAMQPGGRLHGDLLELAALPAKEEGETPAAPRRPKGGNRGPRPR